MEIYLFFIGIRILMNNHHDLEDARFTFRQSQDILQANSTPKNPNINHDYIK